MNVETLKKAMPALDSYLKQPTSAEHFKMAMDILQEALDEEERFSSTVPMWHEIANLPTKPHPTKEYVTAWAQGKQYPENPVDVVQKIFNHLRKRGVENPEPTHIRRERHLAQQSMELRSDTPVPAPRTLGQPTSAAAGLPAMMAQVAYGPVLAALLNWRPVSAGIPVGFLQVLDLTLTTIPRSILFDVVGKLHGYHLGTLEAWVHTAKSGASLNGTMQWPSTEAQTAIVKQLMAFLIVIEFNTPTMDPTALVARLRVAARLLNEMELLEAVDLVRTKAPVAGAWNVFNLGYLSGIIAGTLPPPHDAALVTALGKAIVQKIKPHFLQGTW